MTDDFRHLARIYDDAIKFKSSQQWMRIANLPSGGSLLDVGGGTGRVADALKVFVDVTIVSDLSIRMLQQAKNKNGLNRVCSQSEGLPFPDQHFDRIIMVDAFHHIFNASRTSDELWRVLKPGGRLVIEEPDIRTFTVKLVAMVEKLALMRSYFYSPQSILGFFSYSNARSAIFLAGYNSWIIVDKLRNYS